MGAAVVTAVLAVAGVVVSTSTARDSVPNTGVVLAEDAPAPPASARPSPAARTRPPDGRATSSPPGGPPAERVVVVCSDLQQHAVPITEVSTDEPGAVVELAWGPCVVMSREGAVVP